MDYEVYCDESAPENLALGPDPPRYTLLGSIWMPAQDRQAIKASIRALRDKHRVRGEAKWRRVSRGRLEFYAGLVDLFFNSSLRFRTLVLRAGDADIKFHNNDRELMFYKFYYFMLKSWIDDFASYRVFTDVRTNAARGRLAVLERVLSCSNLTASVAVQSVSSGESALTQLADVLTGAVGYSFHRRSASVPKCRIVQQIEQRLRHPIVATGKSEPKFNVFCISPGWRS